MSHGDAVVNRYSIEFSSKTTKFFDLSLDLLTDFMEMYMSWNKLSKRISNSNDRLTKIFALYTSIPIGLKAISHMSLRIDALQ